MLQVKSSVKYRTSSCPELVIMNDLLLDAALAQVRATQPEHATSFDSVVPRYRARPLVGPDYDEGDAGKSWSALGGCRGAHW